MLAGGLAATSFGVKKAVEALSGALFQAGIDVKVFGIGDKGSKDGLDPDWQGSPAEAFDIRGPLKLGYMPKLFEAVRTYRPDLVHLHGIWMHSSLVALQLARAGVAPYVISPHGMLAPASLRYSRITKKLALVLYQRTCLERATGFFATSKEEARDIKRALPQALVHMVPNTVIAPNISPQPMEGREHRLIAVGRQHHVKGYDRLLMAWSLVEEQFPDWRLEIRGPAEGGYDRELARLLNDLGLKRAAISGPVFKEERDALVANSRLFVLPSRTENFSMAVVEALYCGTPVIASHETPWSELERANVGWWVNCEPSNLAGTLAHAMSLREERLSEMSHGGEAWAHTEFSPESVAQKMIAKYIDFFSEKSSGFRNET